jgi:hypothetical protein
VLALRGRDRATPALPTRVRQASLAEGLRDDGPATDAPVTDGMPDVTPDEMRAIFGAFQRGTDRGRRGLPADTKEGTDADDAP